MWDFNPAEPHVGHQGWVDHDSKHLAAPPASVCSELQQLVLRGVSWSLGQNKTSRVGPPADFFCSRQ